ITLQGLATPVPARRPDLLLRPLGNDGRHVVKDPRTGDYYTLGKQESFLLFQLDGEQTAEAVCQAFADQFREPLSEGDLDEFVKLARVKGLLQADGHGDRAPPPTGEEALSNGSRISSSGHPSPLPRRRRSLLYWRKTLFDPDRLFTWLAPKLGFCWTPTFLALSAGSILLAAVLLWANRGELAGSLASALRWETAAWAWLVLALITALHESAHGLTCKRH